MYYFDRGTIEMDTGFAASDFRQGGDAMSESQWDSYIERLDDRIAQMIHRYCNVVSFLDHTVTELHDGRGCSGDVLNGYKYRDDDYTFTLRECPVISVTSVDVDMSPLTALPDWTAMSPRSDTDVGDYSVVYDGPLAAVVFHTSIPTKRIANVRISYRAGYEEGSQEFDEIKYLAIQMATSALLRKRKVQEASTIRNMGVKDYGTMFEMFGERSILSDDIRYELHKYRVMPTVGGGKTYR